MIRERIASFFAGGDPRTPRAGRSGLTEGQLYSVGVTLIVIALLAASLPRLHGVIDDTKPSTVRPTSTSANDGAVLPTEKTSASSLFPDSPFPPEIPSPSDRESPSPSGSDDDDGGGGGAEGEPPLLPCPAEAQFDAAKEVIFTLDALTLDVLPARSTARALAIALGCSGEDTGIVVIALLMEIGDGLPETGFDNDLIPVLPPIDLPGEIVELVQPARPAIDPVCENVATIGALIILAASHYPAPIDFAMATTVFQALTVCGQVQKIGASAA